jgi:hypothetical protein
MIEGEQRLARFQSWSRLGPSPVNALVLDSGQEMDLYFNRWSSFCFGEAGRDE